MKSRGTGTAARTASGAHRVTVALRMAGIAGQDKLNGIFNYLGEGHRWQLSIYRTQHEFTAAAVAAEIRKGSEGFLVGIPGTDDALAALAATDVPTVVLNVRGGGLEHRSRNIAWVKSDSAEIGRKAARELLRQGLYRCFAYAGYRTDEDWSRERGTAFRDELERAGFIGRMFDLTHYPDRIEDRATMREWLTSLPKPCGILAACDDRAFELLDTCREAGLRVPHEIAILGVNNDPILCENAAPRLSSVQPDFIREGRLAAELLDRMLADTAGRRRPRNPVHLVGVRQIVHRETTHPLSEAGLLVQKALAYIDRNALRGIGVQDVARELKISYSLLNLRFQELQQMPVYEAILRRRLAEVKRLLATTDEPLDVLAEKCGWHSPAALRKTFRTREGLSPRAWKSKI